MISSKFTIVFAVAIACGFQIGTSTAFTTVSRCQKPGAISLIGATKNGKQYHGKGLKPIRSWNVLNSSPDPNMSADDAEAYGDESGDVPSMSMPTSQQQPETPAAYVPPPPAPTQNAPPAVRQPRMDPLMASLTRDTSNASPDQPTQNVPLFGEIPADGTLMLLAPAVVFAVLGFIYSIVIAFNSSDRIVDSVMQAGDSIAQQASNRNNRVYDQSVCRGLCAPQQEDVEGLRNFMEAITKNAREGN